MAADLASNWWAVVIRGVAAILFGILTFVFPPAAVASLVLLFGAWALVDGVFNLVAAFRAPKEGKRWGSLALEGIVGILAGLVAFFFTGLTAIALVMLVASWSLVTGILEIVAAIRLRKQIEHEWFLGLMGLLSVLFGIALFLAPAMGAIVLALWIGGYAIAFGALLVALGIKLRSWSRQPGQTQGQPTVAHA